MIGFIKGKVRSVDGNTILILTDSGVGYNVVVKPSLVGSISEEIEVYTHHYVREDKEVLYGFVSPSDIKFFEKLLTVSGIGPSGAMDILTNFSFEEFTKLIIEGSVAKLCEVRGIGKKTAQRLIVELGSSIVDESGNIAGLSSQNNEKLTELKGALSALGFSLKEINSMVSKLTNEEMENGEIKSLVMLCLRNNK